MAASCERAVAEPSRYPVKGTRWEQNFTVKKNWEVFGLNLVGFDLFQSLK